MIIRRQLYPQNKFAMKKLHDNGMEFKPIYKKPPQTNSTSSGTSAMQDIDDLLKPIPIPKQSEETNSHNSYSSKERTERNLWRNDEVMEMLHTMQEVKALEKLNDKTVKSEHVFKDVELIMHRNGFVKKSHVQIWTKWKFLKSTYMTSRRNGVIPRIVPPQIYEMIHQMIVSLSQSLGDSCSSIDGDSSSASGMVISGVEGGVANGNDNDDDSFSMAHPIFGYRLGMIKPEPVDTGYEPVNNKASQRDPLQEVLPSTKSDKEAKDEQNLRESKSTKEALPVQKVIEIPHRGRGRPPKNPPAATSTPNNPASPAIMPPLRVAPFANAVQTSNDIAASRPPPPLTMPPTPRIRVANLETLKNGEPSKFVSPKLMPKPLPQRNSPPLQLAHNRSSSTPSPSYPKMKQIPMRKTPYSLRPDRAIPDLDVSLSPPPAAAEKTANKKLEEVASTKHLIMHSSTSSNNFQNMPGRKRRSDWQDPIPAPSKQPKYNNSNNNIEEKTNSRTYNVEYDKNYGKVLQNVIIDLSSSLRKMQTDMMRDFFNKQNELLEREHKFQMQQDLMVMKTFQEQTQEIMNSVNHLVGSMKPLDGYQQNFSDTSCRESKPKRRSRIREKYMQEQEAEIEGVGNQVENNNVSNEENEIEAEGQSQEQPEEHNEMGHESDDVYTDDEEQQQQDDMDDTDETDRDDMVDANANEGESGVNDDQDHSQQNENGLTTEDNDDSSNSSLDDD